MIFPRRGLWGVLLLLGLLIPGQAHAGDGEVITLPNTRKISKSGLLLRIDTNWVCSPGYRPIHLQVETADGRPSPKDRRLTLEFAPHDNWGRTHRVTGELILPQGQTAATGHLIVPQTSQWYQADIATYENGNRIKDLSQQYQQVNRLNHGFQLGQPTMLIIDSNAPTAFVRNASIRFNQNLRNTGRQLPVNEYNLADVRGLWQWNPASGNMGSLGSQAIDDATIINIVQDSANLEMLPPGDLPEQWIAYSGVDMIFLSLTELRGIRGKQPQLCEALKRWSASGGNLVVYGLGHDYNLLPQLETILGLTTRADQTPLDRWLPGGNKAKQQANALDQLASSEWSTRRQYLANHPDPEIKKTSAELTEMLTQWQQNTINNPEWQPMRVLGYGHGNMVALPEADPFPGSHAKWNWLESSIKPYKSWNARVGIDLENGDPQFLAYSIPEVGLPPVTTFCLLITLFVVVIGPVNYLLLKRRKRLFLLLVTVPLGAAIVTASLFGYAIIKDGLRVRTRVHSFTSLDQRAGLASSWSRQTYFASLPPSRGLVFPDTATVYPIYDASYNIRNSQQSGHRLLEWDSQEQRLRLGYLASRTTTEFLVTHSEPMGDKQVLFKWQAAGKPPRVTNQLGVTIEKLLIMGDDGSTYWLENLPAEATATPQSQKLEVAFHALRLVANENRPVDPFASQRSNSYFGSYRNYPAVSSGSGAGILNSGRYGAMNVNPQSDTTLQPGEFLAITTRSPFIPLGVDTNNEEASFHVIVGRYVPQ